jgi:ketosteroid isomerase-like protein
MSEADIETLRSSYEAVSRGDWDAAFRTMHRDFQWKPPDRHPVPGTYLGRDEFRRQFEARWKAFEEVVFEPEEFLERGNRIVAFVLVFSRPKGSSATLQMRVAHLWTMRDGKAARCEVFPERAEALEAAGLSE